MSLGATCWFWLMQFPVLLFSPLPLVFFTFLDSFLSRHLNRCGPWEWLGYFFFQLCLQTWSCFVCTPKWFIFFLENLCCGWPLPIALGEGVQRMNVKILVHVMCTLAELHHSAHGARLELWTGSMRSSAHWCVGQRREQSFTNDAFVSRGQF